MFPNLNVQILFSISFHCRYISVLNGCYDASSVVWRLFLAISSTTGASYTTIFRVYAFTVVSAFLLIAIFVWPQWPYPNLPTVHRPSNRGEKGVVVVPGAEYVVKDDVTTDGPSNGAVDLNNRAEIEVRSTGAVEQVDPSKESATVFSKTNAKENNETSEGGSKISRASALEKLPFSKQLKTPEFMFFTFSFMM